MAISSTNVDFPDPAAPSRSNTRCRSRCLRKTSKKALVFLNGRLFRTCLTCSPEVAESPCGKKNSLFPISIILLSVTASTVSPLSPQSPSFTRVALGCLISQNERISNLGTLFPPAIATTRELRALRIFRQSTERLKRRIHTWLGDRNKYRNRTVGRMTHPPPSMHRRAIQNGDGPPLQI